jgi:hypothetical protein
MTERERIVTAIAESLTLGLALNGMLDYPISDDKLRAIKFMADDALRIIETPASDTEPYYVICTCGQNGYPTNSPYSNHAHTEECPHGTT